MARKFLAKSGSILTKFSKIFANLLPNKCTFLEQGGAGPLGPVGTPELTEIDLNVTFTVVRFMHIDKQ